MIKRGPLPADALVGQALEEGDDVGLLLFGETMAEDPGGEMLQVADITRPVIELQHFLEALEAAVMHIRAGQFHIAQRGNLESPQGTAEEAGIGQFVDFTRRDVRLGHLIVYNPLSAITEVLQRRDKLLLLVVVGKGERKVTWQDLDGVNQGF